MSGHLVPVVRLTLASPVLLPHRLPEISLRERRGGAIHRDVLLEVEIQDDSRHCTNPLRGPDAVSQMPCKSGWPNGVRGATHEVEAVLEPTASWAVEGLTIASADTANTAIF